MSNQLEEQSIKDAIENFAQNLNAADAASVSAAFTAEGKFLPDGFETINSTQVSQRAANSLAATAFHIEFEFSDINIEENTAYVIANASTSKLSKGETARNSQSSRDFFVLKKVEGTWKIHRYVFNNVKAA
ncbi:hypothetical protein PBAL39_23172 [Pedobacter sp. BAL39]|uniref:nuclear transport factor 2 family protein n=1 Tax=Pedobacter sp. BAL39 TaxID=391596 RepID=UPI0001559E42|nr:nuclear transport factor 2 family protein [Pedobacter sp. BAL39]EDM35960.1 hypothetical protein PBAL39_23172 [Pedobacter sp. BAL39]